MYGSYVWWFVGVFISLHNVINVLSLPPIMLPRPNNKTNPNLCSKVPTINQVLVNVARRQRLLCRFVLQWFICGEVLCFARGFVL